MKRSVLAVILLVGCRRQQEPPLEPAPLLSGKPTLVVSKSARRLTLFMDGREAFSTHVALGGAPVGAKRREGDRRTPEGDYFVCTRNERSRYHLFLGLSYPNADDAEAGLKAGLISRAQRDEIARRIRAGDAPPWDTPLGGAVGIHGSGSGGDWTLGCIALENEDVDRLWTACPLGTPVRIEP